VQQASGIAGPAAVENKLSVAMAVTHHAIASMPSTLAAMSAMNVITGSAAVGISVQVRLYNDKALMSVHSSPSPVKGLCAGRYAREDNSLIAVTAAGGLDIKVRQPPAFSTASKHEWVEVTIPRHPCMSLMQYVSLGCTSAAWCLQQLLSDQNKAD
jgi:hypothetical protein